MTDALAGLDAALAAGFSPVKVNALLLGGVEDEIDAFVALAREREVHVRFIEYMPIDRRHHAAGEFVPAPQVLAAPARAATTWSRTGADGHGPAQLLPPGRRGGHDRLHRRRVRPLLRELQPSAPDRRRPSEDCLFSGEEIDVRPLSAARTDCAAAIAAAVAGKASTTAAEAANERAMSQIGG